MFLDKWYTLYGLTTVNLCNIGLLVYQTIFPSAPPNKKLRYELENKSLNELQQILQTKITTTTTTFNYKIDFNNKRKIIRCLEIIDKIGYLPQVEHKQNYQTLSLLLQDLIL